MNNRIRVPEVRCIGPDGQQIGVITTRDALERASREGMDLVEISPNAQPPVCRIMDYGKFKYEQEKKDKQARRHQSATRVKEVQFHPNVGDHDYQTKVRHTREFLQEGHRVKIGLFFRGRERAHEEIGFAVMNRVLKDCQDIGTPEQMPRFIGRAIFMLLCPKPGAKPKAAEAKPAPAALETAPAQ
ncbi:MAG TPA: translation initiation factor IF-3 [Kiritimatiellia bacterium]|nr:translation initiation factor IF-3 [Kiritimatiellia bacterium]HRZ13404.1 translation initiation factor IF-3 [Kiritimatiellia bacterium]HSA18956.1 translation initiation factor IF-3 [Kiritimatiellia bacterium]